jgi:hypothetical protein
MVWKRDALSSLLFNFALGHAIREVQVSEKAPKLKGDTIYADNVIYLAKHTYHKAKQRSSLYSLAGELF